MLHLVTGNVLPKGQRQVAPRSPFSHLRARGFLPVCLRAPRTVRSTFAFSCSASSLFVQCFLLRPPPIHWPFDWNRYLVGWPPLPSWQYIHNTHARYPPFPSPQLPWGSPLDSFIKQNRSLGQLRQFLQVAHVRLHEWLLPVYTEETFIEFCRVIFREAESSRVLNLHWKVELYPKKVEVSLAQRHVSHWTVKKCIRGDLTLLLVVLHSAF